MRVGEGEGEGEGEAVSITASFGVAVREGPMSLDQLLQAADSALYRAKDAGRDCVVCSAVSGVAL